MTSSELWSIYTTKNPKMGTNDDTQITLTSRGLKKLFETTWERAHEAGFENGKAWEKTQTQSKSKSDPMSIFDEVFGKKS